MQFGPANSLVGTLVVTAHGARVPGVVLMSSGFASRSGPNRLNVRLARSLAAAGHSTLRFDYSGVGDSPRAAQAGDEAALRKEELGLAIDALVHASGCSRVILVGLCASTDYCIARAREDRRVVGLVLLDPFSYANWKSKVLLLLGKLAVPDLRARVRRQLQWPVGGDKDALPSAPAVDRAIWNELRPKPSRQQFAHALQELLARGVELLVVHTSYAAERHNYEGQFADTHPELRGLANIRIVWLPMADHTYSRVWMKERLFAALERWLGERITH